MILGFFVCFLSASSITDLRREKPVTWKQQPEAKISSNKQMSALWIWDPKLKHHIIPEFQVSTSLPYKFWTCQPRPQWHEAIP